MGKTNSKTTTSPSFDYIKSEKQTIGGRKKNVPLCLLNKSEQNTNRISISVEKPPYFVENTMLIWLDSSLQNPNESSQKLLHQLRRIINIMKTFSDVETCYKFINSIKNEKIFLIVSGSFGPQIVPRIGNFEQIQSIYIFCGNKTNHEQWVKQYKQIKSIHTSIKELCEALKYDIRQYDYCLAPITILPSLSITDLNDSNKEFVYLQMMKGILLEMHYDKKFRKEFIDFAQSSYSNVEQQLQTIETFEQTYQMHSPIWWYTKKCFLYFMLRKAFYIQDFQIINKLAFFIRDLHKDIKKTHLQVHNHQYHPITVYRAAYITPNNLEKIEKNPDGLLSFNDFLITTLERNIALKLVHYISNDLNLIAVLYIIDIDPEKSSIPYVALHNLSYLPNTDSEILFSMNTIFNINGIEKIHEHFYEIKLIPANRKDQQIKELVGYMQDATDGLSGWYRLSKIMMNINEYDQAENIYKYIYNQTSERRRDEQAFIQHELGYISDLKNDLPNSINHYKQAIQIHSSSSSTNPLILLPTYTNLASVLAKQGDFNGAMEQYQRALKIKTSDEENTIIQYNNIGKILQQQGKYSEAQQTYEKALQTLLENCPSAHPLLADIYHNMAGMFYSMKNYSQALTYYEKTLEIDEKFLPSNHPSLVSTYFNIATTYEGLQNYKKAKKYTERAIEIARVAFGDEHKEVKDIMNYLEKLQEKFGILSL